MTICRRVLSVLAGLALCGLLVESAYADTFKMIGLLEPGAERPVVSADGRFVAFDTMAALDPADTNGGYDIYLQNLDTDQITWVSRFDAATIEKYHLRNGFYNPSISDDGNVIAFIGHPDYLVRWSGGQTALPLIFAYDRTHDTLHLVSAASDGAPANLPSHEPIVSGDGLKVAFTSFATNLLPSYEGVYGSISDGRGYIHDLRSGETSLLGRGYEFPIDLSFDANYAVYKYLTFDPYYAVYKFFIQDIINGTTIKIDNTDYPNYTDIRWPTISGDGRFIAFASTDKTTFPYNAEVFVYDQLTKTTELISPASGMHKENTKPFISNDGRFVLINSSRLAAAPGEISDFALYLHDRKFKTTERLPIGDGMHQFNRVGISGDGSKILFETSVKNIFPGSLARGNATFIYSPTPVEELASLSQLKLTLSADQTTLWPPNSRMVEVKVKGSSAIYPPEVSFAIKVEDEYGILDQTIPGRDGAVQLEAWREGDDYDGRTYTISLVASDGKGGEAKTSIDISVPHSMKK